MDPDDHVAAARLLQHPIAEPPQTDLDLSFAVEAYSCCGLRITDYRRSRLHILCKLAKAVRPLDECLLARRHCKLEMAPWGPASLLCHASRHSPVAQGLAFGFELGGELPVSNMLLPVAP